MAEAKRVKAKAPEAVPPAKEIAQALEERLAEEIRMYDVSGALHWTQAVVVASAQNRIHLGTIRTDLSKWLKAKGITVKPEGEETDTEWVLFDLGPVVVHLLTPKGRDYWDLDHLWEECPRIT